MLDHNMKEARVGEVDIGDVDPDTLKLMLEFIYSGQVGIRLFSKNVRTITLLSNKVKDENYTAELLYAADKYELSDLVNI